ncbi:MAG TPA: sugar ABC transporter substrate-binding protein, partial [Atribacteraceae bacterium]|nr:sugar ABC transporter substrate-binding protein [Atribacteraceae bacterium]
LVSLLTLLVSFSVHAATKISPEFSDQIDWRQFEGTTLNVLFSIHPWQEAIEPLIPQFEELTGITVRLTTLPEGAFMTKISADMTAGTFGFDVFMSQYYDAPKYALENWTASLDPFFEDTDLTDPDWYDWEDFFPGARAVATVGAPHRDRIAITSEAQVLVYRKDIFEELGLQAPETFDELLAVAQAIEKGTDLYGITIRGAENLWWPLYGVVRSFGGKYVDLVDYTSKINTEESRAGVDMYLQLLQFTPPGVTLFDWDEINTAMLTGRAAMILDSSVIYPRLQDPERSAVVGNISVAPFPAGPAGRIGHSHYWSISMSPGSANQEAAWLFLQWATSKQIQFELAMKGVLAPRDSVWQDPRFMAQFPADFTEGVSLSLQTAVISPANIRFFEMVDILRAEVQNAFLSGQTPDLASVDAEWNKILQELKPTN